MKATAPFVSVVGRRVRAYLLLALFASNGLSGV